MRFPTPLIEARLERRYKRFLADVTIAGETVTAHCANPGSMMGLNTPGARCFVAANDDPRRKLKYTLEIVEADGGLVAINTSNPNRIADEAVAAGAIPELAGYTERRREVRYGRNSRIDLLLTDPDRADAYVEVKNCHLMRTPGLAEFPDSVTARGAKHLGELADMAAHGFRAVQIFIVQRGDCDRLRPARDLDPVYADALAAAEAAGVELLAYACSVTPEAVTLDRRIPVEAA